MSFERTSSSVPGDGAYDTAHPHLKSQPNVEARAERLARNDDVRQALKQSARPADRPVEADAPTAPAWGLAGWLSLLIALAVASHLLNLGIIPIMERYRGLATNVLNGAISVLIVWIAARLIDRAVVSRMDDAVARFNLRRVLFLVAGVLCTLVAASALFTNWYAGVVSVGVVSLLVTLSLQPTITSFIGWIYLLTRMPYRVGDRIQIGDAQGDVIDVGYLDTTLWEFGGPYLSSDHPSGRLIKFPNSMVLQNKIFNYSWSLFPYIWNEIKFSIGYDSDLDWVEKVMVEEVTADIGEQMMERVRVYRELLARTPIDELTVNERPSVVFRVNQNTWIDAIVRYVVDPRQQGRVKTRLIKKLLARLNEHPEKVRFPKGDAR